MPRTLARQLRCRHRAERQYARYPGVEIERCMGCGACWLDYGGTRVRVWWALP